MKSILHKPKTKRMLINFVILSFTFLFSILYANTSRIDPDEYIVKAGDVFLLQGAVLDTLWVRTVVLPTGYVNLLPFADNILVAGKTLSEVYNTVEELFGISNTNTPVTIQLGRIAPIRFNVMGAVVSPGVYLAYDLITLQEAIQMASGLSTTASRRINILRQNKILTYDFNDYFSTGDTSLNPLIMHDDVIMVNLAQDFVTIFSSKVNESGNIQQLFESIELSNDNETIATVLNKLSQRGQFLDLDVFAVGRDGEFFLVDKDFVLQPNDRVNISMRELYVYVNGYVAQPGRVFFNGIGDAQYYISLSGGLNRDASRTKIYIIRDQGERVLYTGQRLEPGDVIFVPESFRTRATTWLIPLSTVVSMALSIMLFSRG
ncbi:MAG: SLBB domain-containing protein [Candidatus Cloacimonetes bacterium]|nr:SLBB domain-containing protein [Candidatus Cloacimonadota bacterium]